MSSVIEGIPSVSRVLKYNFELNVYLFRLNLHKIGKESNNGNYTYPKHEDYPVLLYFDLSCDSS